MRVGVNPVKRAAPLEQPEIVHQLLMPVYVPSLDGYHADALRIVDLALRSIHASRRPGLHVTVVSNGCCAEVLSRLREGFDHGELDRLVELRDNRGKIDALLPLLRTARAPLVTISDADVYFRPSWLEVTHQIFDRFPEAGAVSGNPNPALAWWYSSATTLGAGVRGELVRERLVEAEDLQRFALSLGYPEFFNEAQIASQIGVRRAGFAALVGCGHFHLTLRREVLRWLPPGRSARALDADADRRYLDEPIDRAGGWRLSSCTAEVLHLGNVWEPWMEALTPPDGHSIARPPVVGELMPPPAWRRLWSSRLPWRLRLRLGAAQRRWLRRGQDGDS